MSKVKVPCCLIGVLFLLSGCAGVGSQVKNDYPLKTKITIQGDLFVNPIVVSTGVGQEVSKEIYDTIVSRIRNSGKYSLTDDKNRANYILSVEILEFTAGNRALRFWVGCGSGSAKLHFVCQLIDANGKIVDEQHFKRYGLASLRGGPAIINQMKMLTTDYACNWLRL